MFGGAKIHANSGGNTLSFESGADINMQNGAGGGLNLSGSGINLVGGADILVNGVQAGAIANSTPATITNPADSPSTADILRDDLVANTIPSIQSDFTALAAKVNSILAVLRAAGMIAP